MSNNSNLVDDERSVCLCSGGQPDYSAVTAVAADGSERLLLARHDAIVGPTRTSLRNTLKCRYMLCRNLNPALAKLQMRNSIVGVCRSTLIRRAM